MRGRGLMLVAGARMGRSRAEQEAQMQQQAYKQGQQAQTQQTAQPAPPPPPPPAPTKDPIAELQKLTDLHNSGALTDEEFAAAKKKLLS
jgi:membrane protease subunit (stomatin/prohibitin family)